MCASARAIGACEKFYTIWLRGRGISTGRNGTPYAGVLGPGGSRVCGRPDVSAVDHGGELRAVARGGDATPVIARPGRGGNLGPVGAKDGDERARPQDGREKDAQSTSHGGGSAAHLSRGALAAGARGTVRSENQRMSAFLYPRSLRVISA